MTTAWVEPSNGSDPVNKWYAVTAKLTPGTTLEQYRQMMANLLAERFGLVVHHASKRVSGYNMTVVPGGPKLGAAVEATEPFAPSACARGDDSFSRAIKSAEEVALMKASLRVCEAGCKAMQEARSTSELNWAADWGGFTSRGKVVAKPKRP